MDGKEIVRDQDQNMDAPPDHDLYPDINQETDKSKSGKRGRLIVDKDVLDPIDVHVGSRVRLRRTLLGMSQEKLGEAIGLTFQQVQKYERGTNRISASKLWILANMLDVPVSFFFDDLSEGETTQSPSSSLAQRDDDSSFLDPAIKRETLELVRAYYRINDPIIRRRLFELTKAVASIPDAPSLVQ
ncbi:Transcriptional regulator [Azospirillaceae bacterium]